MSICVAGYNERGPESMSSMGSAHPRQWNTASTLGRRLLSCFHAFALTVESVVGESAAPYESVIDSGVNLDEQYETIRVQLLLDLQSLVQRQSLSGESTPHEV